MSHSQDRRRFFRITDTIGIHYQIVSEDESSDFSIKPSNVFEQLDILDQTIENHLTQLSDSAPEIVSIIEALNEKFNVLLSTVELKTVASTVKQKEASISACGLAFPTDEAIASDTKMQLSIHLGEGSEIPVTAVVIDNHQQDDSTFYTRVEFEEINAKDRDMLIKHIMLRQSALLRAIREHDDNNE